MATCGRAKCSQMCAEEQDVLTYNMFLACLTCLAYLLVAQGKAHSLDLHVTSYALPQSASTCIHKCKQHESRRSMSCMSAWHREMLNNIDSHHWPTVMICLAFQAPIKHDALALSLVAGQLHCCALALWSTWPDTYTLIDLSSRSGLQCVLTHRLHS